MVKLLSGFATWKSREEHCNIAKLTIRTLFTWKLRDDESHLDLLTSLSWFRMSNCGNFVNNILRHIF